MHRFYSDPARVEEDLEYLSPEDARHAVTVLRLKAGDHVEVIRDSFRWEAEILSADVHDVCVRKTRILPSTEPGISVTLFQGIPKADKMDLIVQKATELGVVRIVPIQMNRCVARTDSRDTTHKLDRWRRIAREAGKQSVRCVIPEICDPCPLTSLSGQFPLPELNAAPWEGAENYGPLSFFRDHPSVSSIGILIGPEGGIDPDEINILQDLGFIPITLGKRILRTETAGLAAVSAFMGLYGEME